MRFTPIAASQTLIKLSISFPHWVCCTWLCAADCFVNAEAAGQSVFLIPHSSPGPGSLLPSSTSVSVGLLLCSSDTCHPVSSLLMVCFPSPFLQHKGEKASGLLAIVYQPTLYLILSLCKTIREIFFFFFFFFYARTKIPLEPGKIS